MTTDPARSPGPPCPGGRLRLAVVGAGLAGIACARALTAAGHDARVLERSPAVGGRLASPQLHGRRVDTGASYFTVTDDGFRAVVDDWAQRGLARPWTDTFATFGAAGPGPDKPGPVRWAAPGGLRTLVADLADGLEVTHGQDVAHVGPGPLVDGVPYDAVVLAMPDPQALRLLEASDPAARLLAGRAWEPTLALAAGFHERSWTCAGAFLTDPVLSWVADDGSRRGDGAPVLVAHSTPGFAGAHLAAPEAAAGALTAALRRLLDLPAPEWTSVQRWTFAKPVGARDEPYGLAGRIGLCGDGWGASKVQAAWQSGDALGRALAQLPPGAAAD